MHRPVDPAGAATGAWAKVADDKNKAPAMAIHGKFSFMVDPISWFITAITLAVSPHSRYVLIQFH